MDWLITLHSIWRWGVLLTGIGAVLLGILAATGTRPWDGINDRLGFFFTLAMDIQFLIGIVLWLTQGRWSGGDSFLSWLHPLLMLAAVALAHVGRARSERPKEGKARGMQAALLYGASLLVVLTAIPAYAWPL